VRWWALVVGSLRAMCDSSIRNKKFSSADLVFLFASRDHFFSLRVTMNYGTFDRRTTKFSHVNLEELDLH